MDESSTTSHRTLSLKEINEAKLMILRRAQRLAFSNEIESLKQDQSIIKSSSLFRLDHFLKDNLLRVAGKIKFGKLV